MIDKKDLIKFSECNDSFRGSVREFVARKMSSTIWGQGYIFQSEDKDIENKFKRFENMNKLVATCGFIEKYCSLYGRCIVTINKTKLGDIMINIPNPFYFNGVGKVFVQPQLAVIYQRIVVDVNNFILKTTYTTTQVINEIFMEGQDKTIRVWDKQAEVLEALQIERVGNHDLGFVPVVEITNLPFYQFDGNNEEFVRLTDGFPGIIFEDLMITTIKNFKKELIYCHSRLLISNSDQNVISELKRVAMEGENINISDGIIETETGSDFKAVPGNGDFTKYTSTLDHLMDFYFKFCGGSKFSEGGGAQKTVAETSSVRSAMIESINNKILLRESQFSDLFKKIICALTGKDYGSEENYFIFKINGNVLKDDTSFIDNIQKKIDMQAMSVVDAIQELFNLSRQEAEEKFEQIKKFNEENNLDMQSMMQKIDGSGGKQMDELGEHKSPDKKGEQ